MSERVQRESRNTEATETGRAALRLRIPRSRLIRSTSLSSTCRHCLHSYSSARERLKEVVRGSGGRRSPHNSTYLEFRLSGHQLLAEAGEPAGGEEGGGKECCWCCNLADLLRCTVFSWNLDLQGVGTESYGWGWRGIMLGGIGLVSLI